MKIYSQNNNNNDNNRPYERTKKTMEHEGNGENYCNWFA